MPDSYAHSHNALEAIKLINYTPRNLNALIWGANGPDPLFAYKALSGSTSTYDFNKLASVMHNEKTGLFLQTLFRLAQTNTQKDYCLGFLCHYSLDSFIHPYVEFVTNTYGQAYYIDNGHTFFETALDTKIARNFYGERSPNPLKFAPDLSKGDLEQIITLLKSAVDFVYPDFNFPKEEYLQSFNDFIFVKNFFNSPGGFKWFLAPIAEKVLRFKTGRITSRMQPSKMQVENIPIWFNKKANMYSVDSLDTLLKRADKLSSESISIGLEYFKGKYNLIDFLEDIGNKSYETGIAL